MSTTALGFTAGFTGEEIEHQLDGFGVKHDFVQLYPDRFHAHQRQGKGRE